MQRFLITGGCGFIGSHLADALLAQGHRVRVLDNLSSGRRDNVDAACEIVIGDVTDRDQVKDPMAGVDGVFHLAAIASVQVSVRDWSGTHRVNLGGMVNVLEAAAKARPGNPVPVVYASSAAVYGDNPSMPLAETAQVRPLSAYGADKVGCELHARIADVVHGVPTAGFRIFNAYGPRQNPASDYSGVISIFADRIVNGRPITVYGDGEQSRDFIYVGDVVRFLVAGMAIRRGGHPVFNACTGTATSVNALAGAMFEVFGRPVDIVSGAARPGDIRASVGDPAKAASQLQTVAQTTLADGLETTVKAIGPGPGGALAGGR